MLYCSFVLFFFIFSLLCIFRALCIYFLMSVIHFGTFFTIITPKFFFCSPLFNLILVKSVTFLFYSSWRFCSSFPLYFFLFAFHLVKFPLIFKLTDFFFLYCVESNDKPAKGILYEVIVFLISSIYFWFL